MGKQGPNSSGWIVLGFSTAIFLIIIGLSSHFFGHDAVWEYFGIPTMRPPFADLRVFTGAGESLRLGYDPLYFNPGDPFGRELNHPRIWQHIIAGLGVRDSHTTVIGFLFWGLFFTGIFLVFSRIDVYTALALIPFLFSPATFLALERANNDLIIFFLLCCFLKLLPRSAIVAIPILLAGSFLKFFPVFGLISLFRLSKKHAVLALVATSLMFLAYLAYNWDDLSQIFNSTLKGVTIYAYGVRSHWLDLPLPYALIPAIAFIAFIAFYLFTQDAASSSYASLSQGRFIDSFRVGAGIYTGTFLLGNNWVYRLIFLILVIPQLLEWLRMSNFKWIPLACLISAMLSMWSISFESIPFSGGFDEVLNWLLFAFLVHLLLASLPSWAKSITIIRRPT